MKITKEGQAYINDFASKAAIIFSEFGFTWDGLIGPNCVPTEKDIIRVASENVNDLDKCHVGSETGRILAHKSDFEPGFRLYLDLKTSFVTGEKTPCEK